MYGHALMKAERDLLPLRRCLCWTGRAVIMVSTHIFLNEQSDTRVQFTKPKEETCASINIVKQVKKTISRGNILTVGFHVFFAARHKNCCQAGITSWLTISARSVYQSALSSGYCSIVKRIQCASGVMQLFHFTVLILFTSANTLKVSVFLFLLASTLGMCVEFYYRIIWFVSTGKTSSLMFLCWNLLTPRP